MAATIRSTRHALAAVLAVFLLIPLTNAGDALKDKVLRAAVVPDADVLLRQDGEGWQKAPIQAVMDAIRAEAEAKIAPGTQARSIQVRMDAFVETLGIASGDVTAMLFSARVRGLDGKQGAMTPQLALQQLGLVVAFRTTKPLSLSKIRLALTNVASESGLELLFEKADYKGASLLSAARPDQPGKSTWLPRELTVALLDGDTAVYIGADTDVKAGLDRLAAGAPAPLLTAMQTALDSATAEALTSLFFIPGDAMRAKAKESAVKMQGQNPLFGGAMQALAGLQSVVFDAKGSDRVSMQLTGLFAAPQEVVQMKAMIDGMVLGMGKMLLMQAVGRPIPFIESLTSRQEGNSVCLVADLTEEDIRALIELQAKSAAGAPGGRPGAPGQGPAPQAAPAQ